MERSILEYYTTKKIEYQGRTIYINPPARRYALRIVQEIMYNETITSKRGNKNGK